MTKEGFIRTEEGEKPKFILGETVDMEASWNACFTTLVFVTADVFLSSCNLHVLYQL